MTKDEISKYVQVGLQNGDEPVFRNTKIRVSHVLDDFSKGMSLEEVLKEHPNLTEAHMRAAFAYGREGVRKNERLRLSSIFGFPFLNADD